MRIRNIAILGATIAGLLPLGAPAQTTNSNLFRLIFRANCRALNTTSNGLHTTVITDSNIVASALGSNGPVGTNVLRQFVLAYNTGADKIQVVNAATGDPVTDVIGFDGGASTPDDSERARFAFMFMPGGTNAFGSALIDEHGVASSKPQGQRRPSARKKPRRPQSRPEPREQIRRPGRQSGPAALQRPEGLPLLREPQEPQEQREARRQELLRQLKLLLREQQGQP